MSATKERLIKTLEEELSSFDETVDTTAPLRQEIVNIAMAQVRKINPDEVDPTDPKQATATATVIGAALKALDSQEATAVRRVNAKIKHADQKRADATSDLVIDLYKKVASGKTDDLGPLDLSSDMAAIDQDFLHTGASIPDTELRDDRDDLS